MNTRARRWPNPWPICPRSGKARVVAFLRFLLILLVLLNLLVLAAWQGWLGQGRDQREPERLTNQLHPERIVLVEGDEPPAAPAATPAPQPEPAPVAAPTEPALPAPTEQSAMAAAEAVVPPAPEPEPLPQACVVFDPVNDEQAALVMGDALAQVGFTADDTPTTEISSWWVHIPSQGSREAAERRADELRALGITDLFATGERSARPFMVSLGLFKSAESAAEQVRRLKAKGATGIAVEERGNTTHRIEVRGPAEILSGWASEWSGRLTDVQRSECTP